MISYYLIYFLIILTFLFILYRCFTRYKIIPKRSKIDIKLIGSTAAVLSIQGFRSYQEDRYSAIENLHSIKDTGYYGVFDGHGGSKASEYVSNQLHNVLLKLCSPSSSANSLNEKSKSKLFFKPDSVSALRSAFQQVDYDFLAMANKCQWDDGSTAIVALIHENTLIVANAGDSRAVLASAGKYVPLSTDHKPERIDEKKRIEALGGKVIHFGTWRVQGILSISRSFGDRMLRPYVIAEPDIISRTIEAADDYVILATDGVWDVVTSQEAVDICMEYASAAKSAQILVETATARKSGDNITALVIDLKTFKSHPKNIETETNLGER